MLIFTVLLELVIRAVLPEEVKYNFIPGQKDFNKKYVSLNREGYRDREYPHYKGESAIRIVGLGDSFAFGVGVKNANDTYLKKLESLLNKNSKNMTYEVLNFGKPGIDTAYEIKILKNEALRYKPDIIVIGYVLNDFNDGEAGNREKTNAYAIWFDIYMQRSSYLYYFGNKGISRALEILGIKKSYYNTIKGLFSSETSRQFNKLYFKELKEISNENNATLVLVVFPFIYKLDNYPFVGANNFIKEVGTEYGIEVLDLLPYFQSRNEEDVIVSKFDPHPNEIGHKIAADAIYEKLIKLKLVQ
ncbi:SGNH/GDSL hydrolase family protein [Candidatus Woesearchaeota archaeon]|nr:SGNH/GDSL hydrolase family protein [Candidatus Woesearchaeota archaeon]